MSYDLSPGPICINPAPIVPSFPARGDYVRTADGTRGMIIGSWGIGPDIQHRVQFFDGTEPKWYRRSELTWRGGRPCG